MCLLRHRLLLHWHFLQNDLFVLPHYLIALLKDLPGDVEAKLTGNTVVARARIFVVLCYGFARGDGKLAGETVPHFGNNIFSNWREVNVGGIVGSRTRYFASVDLRSSTYLAEISNTAVFVFRKEVVAFFVDAESYWICARSGQFYPFSVLLMWLFS
jgi:hypothetical protein